MTTATLEKPTYSNCKVKWRQNVRVREYESAEATVEVDVMLNPDADAEQTIAAARDAFYAIRSGIHEQLGMPIHPNEDGVIELVQETFPGTQVVPQVAPQGDHGIPLTPPHDPKPLAKAKAQMTDEEKQRANENQAWARSLVDAGQLHLFHDNRASKTAPNGNPNWPDFKHKDTGIGVWLT